MIAVSSSLSTRYTEFLAAMSQLSDGADVLAGFCCAANSRPRPYGRRRTPAGGGGASSHDVSLLLPLLRTCADLTVPVESAWTNSAVDHARAAGPAFATPVHPRCAEAQTDVPLSTCAASACAPAAYADAQARALAAVQADIASPASGFPLSGKTW
jgi:hypothetical protein